MIQMNERFAVLAVFFIAIQWQAQGFSPSGFHTSNQISSERAFASIHPQSPFSQSQSRVAFFNNNAHTSLAAKEVEEEEEDDEEYEYEEYYEYEEEEEEEEEEENEEEGDDETERVKEELIPLKDDPDDENYSAQLKAITETIARRNALDDHKAAVDESDQSEFLQEQMEQFIDDQFDNAGLNPKDVEKYLKKMSLTEDEAAKAIDDQEPIALDTSSSEINQAFISNLGSDSDAFPDDDSSVYGEGINNKDLVRLQKALEDLTGTIKGFQDGSLIDNKQAMIKPQFELDQLDRQTLDEINLCLNASATDVNGLEYNEVVYNESPTRWLLYDLGFNVTNLMLASCAQSPDSPLILNHWMPQLCAYSRYADVRERDFQFTWEDCESADVNELKRYFEGLGYDEIPIFSADESNVVNLETEYEQEDMTMAAFENWMDNVYNEEGEGLYFDDEDFQPENNVFDFRYGVQDSDELTNFKAELQDFKTEHRNETQAWKDKYVRETNYTEVEDKGGSGLFRGHLVVACCGSDQDLELAESITGRMDEEFGKQVYVETRVYSHARQEDNLYEIWLESYDIELIHSRRGAFYNPKEWLGPADIDTKQLDAVVEKVRYMVSDDARYTYDLHEFNSEV